MKGVSRGKDNEANPDFDKFFRRMVLSCPADILTSYDEIRRLGYRKNTVYRIYISLNSRDVVKANYNFAQRHLKITHETSMGRADFLAKSKKLDSEWKTELEQKPNRGTKRILIDIDDPGVADDVIDFVVERMHTTIYASRATPNGWALSIGACDTRGLLERFKDDEVTIQRDSMLFLERYDGTE